jgi:hypothetical protein
VRPDLAHAQHRLSTGERFHELGDDYFQRRRDPDRLAGPPPPDPQIIVDLISYG